MQPFHLAESVNLLNHHARKLSLALLNLPTLITKVMPGLCLSYLTADMTDAP
jgi:hypothetical protein